MRVMQGRSASGDAGAAVGEATGHLDPGPEILFVFSSTEQDPQGVAAALAQRFPKTEVVGCTTAGEQLGGGHSTGELVVAAVYDSGVSWGVGVLEGLQELSEEAVQAAARSLFEQAELDVETIGPDEAVCMLFIDRTLNSTDDVDKGFGCGWRAMLNRCMDKTCFGAFI